MKQQDIRINGIYFTLVSEEEVAVVVTRVVPPDGHWNKKTRYAVKRADNGQPLPKYRTAAAFRAEVKALPMEKSAGTGLCAMDRLLLSNAWHDQQVSQVSQTVQCKFCGKAVPAKTAHRHDGGYVGDACCWDERLKTTE